MHILSLDCIIQLYQGTLQQNSTCYDSRLGISKILLKYRLNARFSLCGRKSGIPLVRNTLSIIGCQLRRVPTTRLEHKCQSTFPLGTKTTRKQSKRWTLRDLKPHLHKCLGSLDNRRNFRPTELKFSSSVPKRRICEDLQANSPSIFMCYYCVQVVGVVYM